MFSFAYKDVDIHLIQLFLQRKFIQNGRFDILKKKNLNLIRKNLNKCQCAGLKILNIFYFFFNNLHIYKLIIITILFCFNQKFFMLSNKIEYSFDKDFYLFYRNFFFIVFLQIITVLISKKIQRICDRLKFTVMLNEKVSHMK